MHPNLHFWQRHWHRHAPHPNWHAIVDGTSHLLHNRHFWLTIGLVALFAFFLAMAVWTTRLEGTGQWPMSLPYSPH